MQSEIVTDRPGAAASPLPPRESAPASRAAALLAAGACAFVVLLWVTGTLYSGGNLGKWLDDYTVPEIDPVTGTGLPRLIWTFPRPLGWTLVVTKGALLWEHDRINHVISALAHALVAFVLWRLLRIITQCPQAAAVGGILFLVFPLHYELMFWPSAVHAALATGAFAALCAAWCRYARASDYRGSWNLLGWTVLILCLYEQPATGLLALPALYLAVCPADQPWRVRMARMLLPTLVCGCAVLACAALIRVSSPPGMRGGAGTLVTPAELPLRIREIADAMADVLWGPRMQGFVTGAFQMGVERMQARRRGPILGGALILAALAWAARFTLYRAAPAGVRVSRSWLLLFGVGVFVVGWVPIVLVRQQTVETRLFYFPSVGLVVIGSVLLDALFERLARRRIPGAAFIAATMGAAASASIGAAISLVGIQYALAERSRMDRRQLQELTERVPSPAPNTVFVPLQLQDTPTHTGRAHFDQFAIGALSTCWSAPAAIQQAYRRNDVFATYYVPWGRLPLDQMTAKGARYHVELQPFPPHADGGCVIPWTNMVPLHTDAEQHLHLVHRLSVERRDGQDLRIELPLVRPDEASDGGTYLLQWPEDRQLRGLPGWEWENGDPVRFDYAVHWRASHWCTGMHALYPGDRAHARMRLVLPAGGARRLCFRGTLTPQDLERGGGRGDGVEVVWYLEGARATSLARLRLEPSVICREQRWPAVVVDLPESASERTMWCEVGAGPAGNADFDACLVTGGYPVE